MPMHERLTYGRRYVDTLIRNGFSYLILILLVTTGGALVTSIRATLSLERYSQCESQVNQRLVTDLKLRDDLSSTVLGLDLQGRDTAIKAYLAQKETIEEQRAKNPLWCDHPVTS